jgi:prevent-host-death family protein
MTRTISATEARVHFGEVIRRATEEEELVVVTRGGKPGVVILSEALFERLRAGQAAPGARRALERANEIRTRIATKLGGRRVPDGAELVRADREARDAHLVGVLGGGPEGEDGDAERVR